MTVNIYQIIHESDAIGLIFRTWSEFEQQGHRRPPAHLYDRVYSYQTELGTPEGVFHRFNVNLPADYKGRSLSISDVVEFIWDTGERSCFFCDRIGFHAIEFDSFLVRTVMDFSERLALIKADRSACETLMDEIIRRIVSDDNQPSRAGRALIQAFIDNKPDEMLVALCGWELKSLIAFAFEEEC